MTMLRDQLRDAANRANTTKHQKALEALVEEVLEHMHARAATGLLHICVREDEPLCGYGNERLDADVFVLPGTLAPLAEGLIAYFKAAGLSVYSGEHIRFEWD